MFINYLELDKQKSGQIFRFNVVKTKAVPKWQMQHQTVYCSTHVSDVFVMNYFGVIADISVDPDTVTVKFLKVYEKESGPLKKMISRQYMKQIAKKIILKYSPCL